MNIKDKPLILSSQCIIDWENIIDLTFKSNGQVISIHRNVNDELELSGVGIPFALQQYNEKISKHFNEILEKAEKYGEETKKTSFNRLKLEWLAKQQEEIDKIKETEFQTKKEIDTESNNFSNVENS